MGGIRLAERSEFVEVVRERSAAWSRTAFLMCGDWARAEDLLQAALLKLYLKWSRINLDGVDAYARRVILRLAIDESRRPHRRSEVSGDPPEAAASVPDAAAVLDVRAALQQVPAKQRAVLVLRFYHQLSVAEAAEVLRVTQGTVKSQTARGLEKMRELLDIGSTDPDQAEAVWGLGMAT